MNNLTELTEAEELRFRRKMDLTERLIDFAIYCNPDGPKIPLPRINYESIGETTGKYDGAQ